MNEERKRQESAATKAFGTVNFKGLRLFYTHKKQTCQRRFKLYSTISVQVSVLEFCEHGDELLVLKN
jgi:hypothetical protein